MKTVIFALLVATSLATPVPVDQNALNRIVNGKAVEITEVPYQASLRRKVSSGWAHSCGAIVITVRSLLTAAHCVNSYTFQSDLLRVVVGTVSRTSGGSSYDVAGLYLHEDYSPMTLEHDIAIIVTAKKMSFGRSVQPIPLLEYGQELAEGTEALVSGYGVTSYEGTVAQSLQAAVVKIVSQQSCARAYMRIGAITSGMLCASADAPPRDACQGDSGGPLVAHSKLVGIVSWGEGCANVSYPGVYTRVSAYTPWIRNKLSKINW
ncbi:trypsin alpha-3-like [Aricia agestis]|uniref:trypsin alpha-3-like n=1 Tax=Aricia agestis TaxID=91739 RepID=UPI001C2093FC|nr:trypsin alpha-3-like [Aricia agestis]